MLLQFLMRVEFLLNMQMGVTPLVTPVNKIILFFCTLCPCARWAADEGDNPALHIVATGIQTAMK